MAKNLMGRKWRSLYRAIDEHGNPIEVLLAAKREALPIHG